MRDLITSFDNKFYKLLKKLDKKKYRDENNIFKAEGEKFLNEDINFNKIIVKESKFEYFDKKYSTFGWVYVDYRNNLDNLSKNDIKHMLRFANAAASLITTKRGALKVMPNKEEIESLLFSK